MRARTQKPVGVASMIGMGTVGSGWAALLLARGVRVMAMDPGESVDKVSNEVITHAWRSLVQLGQCSETAPPFERLHFCSSIEQAVRGSDAIFENVPEDLDRKQEIIAQIDTAAPRDALILSSSGGLPVSKMQSLCKHPERVLVMHPFNPSYLIPLVEIVPGEATSEDAVQRAHALAHALGKVSITLRREIPGHMVNRLQFALVREATRCLLDGVASPEDIDAAVRFGLAPRWMLMGGLQTVALAGGAGGMRAILDHAGEAMESWWSPGRALELTLDVRQALVEAADRLSEGQEFDDWFNWRDEQLVNLLNVQNNANKARPQFKKGQ